MATKKAEKSSAAVVDADGFVQQETGTGEEFERAEFVEPAEGTELSGELTRVFVMDDTFNEGKKRVAYEYRDADGNLWAFGEKGGFKRAMRQQRIGNSFVLVFGKKVALKDPKGKSRGTMWKTDLRTKDNGTGPLIIDELRRIARELKDEASELPF